MNATEFNKLKTKIQNEGVDDGAEIVWDGGPVFDSANSDWDAEGLNFILSSTRHQLTDEQYDDLLTTYGNALAEGGRNAS